MAVAVCLMNHAVDTTVWQRDLVVGPGSAPCRGAVPLAPCLPVQTAAQGRGGATVTGWCAPTLMAPEGCWSYSMPLATMTASPYRLWWGREGAGGERQAGRGQVGQHVGTLQGR